MWRHVYHRLVVGYHGCDRGVAEGVLLGGEHLKKSSNPWDWLGEGIYFWEHSRRRAFEFAQEQQARDPEKVQDPCVLGAYIFLGRCFDLTDTHVTSQLSEFFEVYRAAREEQGLPLHENRNSVGGQDLLLRELDCAVLNLGLTNLDVTEGGGDWFYQTVRGVFVEGIPAYPGAAIRTKTHVQIAVRDPHCILGYFMPTGYTHDEEDSAL